MSNCLTHKRSRLGPASNIGFLKTYNTEFDKIIITSRDQNVGNRRQSKFDIAY